MSKINYMSSGLIFDTLAYAKKLIEAGVPEKQAEVQASALAEIIEDKIATKRDLSELKSEIKLEIKDLENRLLLSLGGIMVAGVAVVATLVKLL